LAPGWLDGRRHPVAQYLVNLDKPLQGFLVGGIQIKRLLEAFASVVIPALFECHLTEGYEFICVSIFIAYHCQNIPH